MIEHRPWRIPAVAAILVVVLFAVFILLASGNLARTQSAPVHAARREAMVKTQLEDRGIKDKAVLTAMRKVPRERFVAALSRGRAYDDGPLPIGEGQTISQPYIVAWMTELIEPKKAMRVLEIGTGSGYQAAVLAESVGEVDTIEVVPTLGRKAEALLRELGYQNIRTRIGDGYGGWPERAALRRDPPHRGAASRYSKAATRPAQGRRTPRGSCRSGGTEPRADHQDRDGTEA